MGVGRCLFVVLCVMFFKIIVCSPTPALFLKYLFTSAPRPPPPPPPPPLMPVDRVFQNNKQTNNNSEAS